MKSFRVYFIRHAPDRVSGILMERYERFFKPPPAAIGSSEEDVLAQLEDAVVEEQAQRSPDFDRLLWEEELQMRVVRCEVHPLTAVGKNAVIGKQRVPLRLSYAWSPLAHGGYRILLPRYGFRFILEDLAIATDVVRQAVSASLAGESGKWLYAYRDEGEEYVSKWSPALLRQPVYGPGGVVQEPFEVVSEVAEEWVAMVGRNKLEACIGADPLFEEMVPRLLRDPPPSILLVGPAGVGKTTFVRRLARLLLDVRRGKRGERRHIRLWSTSADRIVSGMAYLGMWQERCLKVVEELSGEGDYLYLDRLGELMRPQSDGASIADLFQPAIQSGELSVIAECDARQLERLQQLHPTFIDAMTTIRLRPYSRAALTELMMAFSARRAPTLRLSDAAYRRAISHLSAFRLDQSFPGKAFQFFGWLCRQHTDDYGEAERSALSAVDLSSAFSRYSGLPMAVLSDDVAANAPTIAGTLSKRVIGQDHACSVAARIIARLKAGLNDPERPVGTLLFVGPTGVGKTELAKQLAAFMYGSADRLLRLDMSEYSALGAAQRLLLVGPRLRTLAQRVREQPLSVVLFDEIEKAHREVFDLLLGILDEGRLSDDRGRLVDMRMTLIIMTSNLGAAEARSVGFTGGERKDYRRAVMQHFRPELFNRIDHVVSFERLSREAVEKIVDLELVAVAERIGVKSRRLSLRLLPEARARLAQLGYRPDMGGAPAQARDRGAYRGAAVGAHRRRAELWRARGEHRDRGGRPGRHHRLTGGDGAVLGGSGAVRSAWMSSSMCCRRASTSAWPLARVAKVASPQTPLGE